MYTVYIVFQHYLNLNKSYAAENESKERKYYYLQNQVLASDTSIGEDENFDIAAPLTAELIFEEKEEEATEEIPMLTFRKETLHSDGPSR